MQNHPHFLSWLVDDRRRELHRLAGESRLRRDLGHRRRRR